MTGTTALAVSLATVGAFGYAFGARLQHSGVQDTVDDRGLGLRGVSRLVRNSTWLLGLVALGSGALLHASALGLAPLSVVQPVGVLALPLTVLLNLRQQGFGVGALNASAVLAVFASTGGVALFVLLAAGSATPTTVSSDDEDLAIQLVAGVVIVLALAGLLAREHLRCVAYAAGCAVSYGLVSMLMRGFLQQITSGNLAMVNPGAAVGIVAAMLVGGWLIQHAYASGPPDLVVACLTVIDPMVAVGLGIGLLGEADRVDLWTATGEALCAALACAGVFGLARYHPETQDRQERSTVTGDKALARSASTHRCKGSST